MLCSPASGAELWPRQEQRNSRFCWCWRVFKMGSPKRGFISNGDERRIFHKSPIWRRPLSSLAVNQPLSKCLGVVFGKLQWLECAVLIVVYSNDQPHVSTHQLLSALPF